MFYKIGIFKDFTQSKGKHLCWIPAQVFSCEFWEIFKNIFFYKPPPVTVSEQTTSDIKWLEL